MRCAEQGERGHLPCAGANTVSCLSACCVKRAGQSSPCGEREFGVVGLYSLYGICRILFGGLRRDLK